jgi:hypothetical protein
MGKLTEEDNIGCLNDGTGQEELSCNMDVSDVRYDNI